MIGLPLEMFDLAGGLAGIVLIVFLRIAAMLAVVPVLGEAWLSIRVRIVLALVLTTAMVPAAVHLAEIPDLSPALVLRAILTESVNGLVMGLWLRLFVHALQTAGSIAAQSTSLAQLLGNSAADPMPALGHILMVAALALLVTTGFHVRIVAYVLMSFDILPPLSFPDPAEIAQAGLGQVASCFSLAFALAAPFVILSALYNLTLGFINKAMPQLMVAFVGAPVITLGSVALLLLTAPVMLSVWLGAVQTFLGQPFR